MLLGLEHLHRVALVHALGVLGSHCLVVVLHGQLVLSDCEPQHIDLDLSLALIVVPALVHGGLVLLHALEHVLHALSQGALRGVHEPHHVLDLFGWGVIHDVLRTCLDHDFILRLLRILENSLIHFHGHVVL